MRKRRQLLLTSVALMAAATASNAATFTVSSEAELANAISLAQASGDATSTIALTSSFSITGPLPAVNEKNITIETGANSLSFLPATDLNVAAGASLTITGNITGAGDALNKGGDGALVISSTASGFARFLVNGGSAVVNSGGDTELSNYNGFTYAQLDLSRSDNAVSSLTVTGAGTRLLASGAGTVDMSYGNASQSTLTITDGGQFIAGGGTRIHSSGFRNGKATIHVNGAGSRYETTGMTMANGETFIRVSDGGYVKVNGSTHVGGVIRAFDTSNAKIEVTGTGSRYETDAITGYYGAISVLDGATLTGTVVDLGYKRLGATVPIFDVLVSGSGSSLNADTLRLGQNGQATLTISDGSKVTVVAGATSLVLGSADPNSDAALNFGGAAGQSPTEAGTLEASEIQLATNSEINFNHTEDAYGFDIAINGDGAINHTGPGKTILTADQLGYSGLATIQAGTLEVNGVLGGTTEVHGGILSGTGTVGATTNYSGGAIAPGNSIGTLTIDGDYTSNGGALEIESVLGDDASDTDVLVIVGNSILGSGATQVRVTNVGGASAPTVEGIRIVDVAGASDADSFVLNGDYVFEGDQAVVGGAYAYRLYQNGVSTPTDGDWYLRSSLLPVAPSPTPSPTPLYQPGVPIYETYANVLGSFSSLETLQQRVGNRMWSEARPDKSGVWGRVAASHSKIDPKASTSGAEYDLDLWKMQAGADGLIHENENGRFIGGVSVHYGTVSSDVTSLFGNGSIDATGYGLSGTLTWYGNSGFYVDTQAQVTWFDSDLVSSAANRSLVSGNNGFGYAMGIEVGKRIALDKIWSVTPQAQLVYSDVNFDTFTDAFGAIVGLENGDSLSSRLGISVDLTQEWSDAAGKARRSHVYGVANLYYDFLDGSRSTVSGVEFVSDKEPLWIGAGIGGSYNWNNDQYSLYGEASLNSSVRHFGDSYRVNANAGFRLRW
ncbi:autotransporter outer membrane beta-barrel domain-containing protein [Nitratireductor pacificus]|uniref:autotransporter family protein n=1 Tax=Nitratireductor pacificus TaxID=1231180 RepID=UPI00178C4DC1|nr:autotransporter outer membrane beta-barrel domain-containing protein [Nitratireductor pacificus]